MHVENRWDTRLYDGKMDFVSRFGRGVLEWLQPQPGETILDLGCGTGDLCAEMAKAGAVPTGMDLSVEMINAARSKYPALRFFVANAETFVTEELFDAVFSNAALHWMKRPEAVIRQVWLALKPGGQKTTRLPCRNGTSRRVSFEPEACGHGRARRLRRRSSSALPRLPQGRS